MRQETDLHDYQRAGVDLIIDNPKFGLLLDMGMGKTVTVLTAIAKLKANLEVSKTLVIGTKRIIKDVWPTEVKEWEHLQGLRVSVVAGTQAQRIAALKADADIYCISRDNVCWLCALYGGFKLPFDTLVVDESSSFKNHGSNRFKSLKRVIDSFSRVYILTGTFAPRSLLNAWPQMYLLDKGQRLGHSITAYREAYFTRSRDGFGYDLLPDQGEVIAGKIKDITTSMMAKDYLDLPPVVYNNMQLRMDDKTSKLYKDFERSLVLELTGGEITALNAAGLITKLSQLANGHIYDANKLAHHVHDIKLDALAEIIEANEGKPIFLAYEFQSDCTAILARFAPMGARKLSTSKDIEDWNAGRVPLLIAHPASAAHGLNLQHGGHIVVWFSPTFDLELHQQFNTRIARQGQKAAQVYIHTLVLEGSVDERKLKSLADKGKTQDAIIEAVKFLIKKYLKK